MVSCRIRVPAATISTPGTMYATSRLFLRIKDINYQTMTTTCKLGLGLLLVLGACRTKTPSGGGDLAQLSIHWTLLANTAQDECVAEFTFVNEGPAVFDRQDWTLFFNQNTLSMGALGPDSAKGVVQHINGDLYQFKPGRAFSLAPADTLRVRYTYQGMLIKERDAPAGAYFVVAGAGHNETILRAEKFTITPFDQLSALVPDPAVLLTIPTASSTYAYNEKMLTLAPDPSGKIIPTPHKLVTGPGRLLLPEKWSVHYAPGLEAEANYFISAAQKMFGRTVQPHPGLSPSAPDKIILELESIAVQEAQSEAYQLTVSAQKGIKITGQDAAGVFYGLQSLLGWLWAHNFSGLEKISIPDVQIMDMPRFAYRGFLLDVARNFQRKEEVLRLIDLLAMYKINKLNLRLTDDEGWRIEIAGLPELTTVGAKRGHTHDSKQWLTPSFGSGHDPYAADNYGTGFYSRADFKEIILYAHARHIQVIPEICLPSHARAAIKAMEARYAYYLARNDSIKANEFRLIDPLDESEYLSAQMYRDNIVCVARPSVYHFYETVVQDLMRMYAEAGLKMTLFNTGGDEVPAGAWTRSPLCQALMSKHPELRDVRQLQGYFLEKSLAIFEKYQLQITGWEEIVLNKDQQGQAEVNSNFIGKNILPLVWDNTGDNIDLGYRIANAGYPVVLCNVTNLYFDLAYNTDPTEPGLYWGGFQDAIDPYVLTPADVYKSTQFDMFSRLTDQEELYPGKQRLQDDRRQAIVGLQAQLWTETVKGPDMLEYYLVPKIFAFAEKAWAPAPTWESESRVSVRNQAILKGWGELAQRIGHYELTRLDRFFGPYNYRIPPPGAVLEQGWLKANSLFPGLILRYTTDGSDPQNNSPAYTAPVQVDGPVNIRAFNAAGRGGKIFAVKEKNFQ